LLIPPHMSAARGKRDLHTASIGTDASSSSRQDLQEASGSLMELDDPSTPDDDRPSIANAHEGRCATPPPSPERLPPSPEPISSPTRTVDTEIAPTIISLQLKRDDIAVFQAAPHLLAEAAVEECLLRSDDEYGGLELLIGIIVRVHAPFRDPRFPMYCAARVAALRGSAIEVDLLDGPTVLALGEERRTVTITDLSNQMLSAEERLAAGLPHVVDAATALATGLDMRGEEAAILSAVSTQLYAAQLQELRRPCGYVACGDTPIHDARPNPPPYATLRGAGAPRSSVDGTSCEAASSSTSRLPGALGIVVLLVTSRATPSSVARSVGSSLVRRSASCRGR